MIVLNRCLLFFFTLVVVAGCKSKKTSLAGEEPVEVSDFIDFFPEKKLPYLVTDTSLLKKDKDSLLISYKVFTQFVPDTVLAKVFGKGAKPKIFPLAKKSGDEIYLFAKAITPGRRAAFVLGFNKKNEFIAGMPLILLDESPFTVQTTSMDTRYTISKNLPRKNADGSTSDGKEVFVLNNEAKNFMLI